MRYIKFFLVFLFLFTSFFLIFLNKKDFQKDKKDSVSINPNHKPVNPTIKEIPIRKVKQSIFFVDWMLNQEINVENLEAYCPIIYFGSEAGIALFKEKIASFSTCKKFLLTKKTDDVYPSDSWQKEIERLIKLVKENEFQGVVLDLEIRGLGNQKKVDAITQMVRMISESFKEENLYLAVALYGDTFYRKRPFNVKEISNYADEVMVMAYDFSKSYGEPGPNFPFSGKDIYGYDFQLMVDDFLTSVEKEKLTVIFGMFGYDWQVDEKKRPFSQAKALTLKQIKEKFLNENDQENEEDIKVKRSIQINCFLENCLGQRDDKAKEVEINYTLSNDTPDEEGIYRIDYHILWFEDEESVGVKREFLKKKGISAISFWAAGYF